MSDELFKLGCQTNAASRSRARQWGSPSQCLCRGYTSCARSSFIEWWWVVQAWCWVDNAMHKQARIQFLIPSISLRCSNCKRIGGSSSCSTQLSTCCWRSSAASLCSSFHQRDPARAFLTSRPFSMAWNRLFSGTFSASAPSSARWAGRTAQQLMKPEDCRPCKCMLPHAPMRHTERDSHA